MYDPYTDYFGLSQLLHNCQREDDCRSTTTTSHLNMLKDDFNSNGTVSDFNNNMVSPNSITALQSSPTSSPAPVNGFLPLPLQISDITELSKVMRGAGRRRVLSGNGRPQIVSWCVFCKNNGESEMVYASHKLKSEEGLTTCPILRAYTCPLCGTNGDHAHTIKYCPLNKLKEGGEIGGVSTGPGTIGSQYRTPRTSTGRRRTSSISLSSGGTL